MGQAVPPISVTCSKWYIRRAPFVLRRSVWEEFTSFSPFCGRKDIRFPERKLRFARILSNTSGFTCHKDNEDWALRRNRLSTPFQPPRPINRLENF
jgi:hypothetical protein